MGCFVISKSQSGEYKFVYASRKGHTVFTSIKCKRKSDCEEILKNVSENFELFTLTKSSNASGKFFFRLSKDGLVIANSRRFSTELALKKGIDEIIRSIHKSEILDFSELENIFPPAEDVFNTETLSEESILK